MKYKDYNDYELLSYVSENNEEASEILYEKYKPLIEITAKKMIRYCANTGLEVSDLIQEGMVGLSLAINSYKEQKDASFYTYAKMCIDRKIISTVISSKRLKHKILNESLSLEATDNEGNEVYGLMLSDETLNPEKVLVFNEEENELLNKTYERLTDFEREVFDLKKSDFSYREIASILDKSPKAIDNALQRIRTKIMEVKKEI
ncbi:MAG: sigma-70 family RNA polymerase sigma factor [Bacilli bacterium]|nr:sigma-70 family RNA polymerase sigma factor [Bacilli bacterium]